MTERADSPGGVYLEVSRIQVKSYSDAVRLFAFLMSHNPRTFRVISRI